DNTFTSLILQLLYFSLILNVTFAVFNLMPIPPLDGGQILMTFLSPSQVQKSFWLYRYGIFILMGILLIGYITGFNIFWIIAEPIIRIIEKLIIKA
ncbi:MAG: site-2 protease family protein, partial [Canidatus Methanoxibalbensis ujae]|nr:site-2 protease family protein [Candidatus Methanoxibalbensis ujae]